MYVCVYIYIYICIYAYIYICAMYVRRICIYGRGQQPPPPTQRHGRGSEASAAPLVWFTLGFGWFRVDLGMVRDRGASSARGGALGTEAAGYCRRKLARPLRPPRAGRWTGSSRHGRIPRPAHRAPKLRGFPVGFPLIATPRMVYPQKTTYPPGN